MSNSSFLCKEINFTKNGKIGKNGKIRNCYHQLLASIKHSLRLEKKEDDLHIIDTKTKDNIIYTNKKNYLNNDEITDFIEKDILEKIKFYENIDNKENRLKTLKQFQDYKTAISKKFNLENLNNLIKDDLNLLEICEKMGVKNDKRTLKTLENYVKLKKEHDEIKSETRAYQNQILVKEIIFKIPENQALNVKKEDWITIQNNFLNNYFKEYELYFSSIHTDEGSENKSHLHMFLSGFNKEKNDFDINEKIFNDMNKKYDLELDFNNKEHHTTAMKKFQEDFFIFFNTQLSLLQYGEKIKLKEYTTEEEIKKKLKIKKEDELTIKQKHEKYINEKINEKLEKMRGEKPAILKHEIKENYSFLNNKTTFNLNLEVESKLDIKKINDCIKNYSNVSNFVQNLQQEKQDLNNKFQILKEKNEIENKNFNEKFNEEKNELLQKIRELKKENELNKNENFNENKLENLNVMLKNIILKILGINLFKIEDFNENDILEIYKNNEKLKKIDKEKLENERLKRQKNTENNIEIIGLKNV